MVGNFQQFLKEKTTGGYLEKLKKYMSPERLEKVKEGLRNEYFVAIFLQEMGYEVIAVNLDKEYDDIDFILNNKYTISIKSMPRALKYGNVVLELGNHYKQGWFYTSKADIWIFVVEDRLFWDYSYRIRMNAFSVGKIKYLSKRIREINQETGFRGVKNLENWALLTYPLRKLRQGIELATSI